MNSALFCLLSAVFMLHACNAAVAPAPAPPPKKISSSSSSTTRLLAPLANYQKMMAIGSPLTAQVFIVTSGGSMSWNNSVAYCQNTFSGVMNSNCYLAELLTAQQIKALGNELIGNNWSVWVGAYLKPLKKGANQWVWYHTGYPIDAPAMWLYGYPLALTSSGNWAATVNVYTTWGAVLQNYYSPATSLYFACTCY